MEYDNKKSGFSLAETMVALVIVALVLAAAAPLVAKKMTNDAKRYLYAKDENVYAAAGTDQVLNIGSRSDSKKVKLKVNGGATVEGDLTVKNKDASSHDVTMILAGDGIKKGTTGPNDVLFKIDPSTRETNIEIAIPDYSKVYNSQIDVEQKAPSNGFVFVKNATRGYIIQNCSSPLVAEVATSSPANPVLNFKLKTDLVTYAAGTDLSVISIFPMLVPISKGQCYQCNNSPLTVGSITFDSAEYENICYFIPLKHAVTEVIPAP